MKINKKTNKKSDTLPKVLSALIIIAGIAISIYIITTKPAQDQTSTNTPPIDSSSPALDDDTFNKEDYIKSTEEPDDTDQPDPEYSLSISAEKSSNSTHITIVGITNAPSGTCDLTISSNGKEYTKSVPIGYAPEHSQCAGYSVPIDSLGYGTWLITINITSGTTTNTKSLTYEVAK